MIDSASLGEDPLQGQFEDFVRSLTCLGRRPGQDRLQVPSASALPSHILPQMSPAMDQGVNDPVSQPPHLIGSKLQGRRVARVFSVRPRVLSFLQ